MDGRFFPGVDDSGACFAIDYSKVPHNNNMSSDHYHDFYEIYLYLGNEMTYFIENETFTLKMNDVILVDRFNYHRTFYPQSEIGSERLLITFEQDILSILDKDTVERIARLFKIRKLTFKDDTVRNDVCLTIRRLYSAYSDVTSNSRLLKSKLILSELLLTLLDMAEKGLITNGESLKSQKEKRISDIVTYINENYRSNITLGELSRRFFVNRYYLCHIFKATTGLGVVDYINTRRLAEAERLLKYSIESVTEICQFVGFNSISHFISLFKKNYGCSPGKFRNIHIKNT